MVRGLEVGIVVRGPIGIVRGLEVGIVNGEGPRGRDSQWVRGLEVGIVNG